MALQLTVCTPLFFFSDCTDYLRPSAEARRFCRDVQSTLSLRMEAGPSTEFFTADIPSSPASEMDEALYEHCGAEGERLNEVLGADIALPFQFPSPQLVQLPNYVEGQDAHAVSTFALAEAVAKARHLLIPVLDDAHFTECQLVLAIYEQAIVASEKHQNPVFWIY